VLPLLGPGDADRLSCCWAVAVVPVGLFLGCCCCSAADLSDPLCRELSEPLCSEETDVIDAVEDSTANWRPAPRREGVVGEEGSAWAGWPWPREGRDGTRGARWGEPLPRAAAWRTDGWVGVGAGVEGEWRLEAHEVYGPVQ
jgi:hypothetical protein